MSLRHKTSRSGNHAYKRFLCTGTRYIAATNRNLAEMTQNGSVRQDLFFRLNVINLHITPLSERNGDVELLCYFFLKKFATLM